MDVKRYLATLSTNLSDDVDTVLGLLYTLHNEHKGVDTEEIKQDFEELYETMHDKPLREKDGIIDAVCRLCRDHEKSGFVDGIRLGIRLAQEINGPIG